jgi:hypothetical protein
MGADGIMGNAISKTGELVPLVWHTEKSSLTPLSRGAFSSTSITIGFWNSGRRCRRTKIPLGPGAIILFN